MLTNILIAYATILELFEVLLITHLNIVGGNLRGGSSPPTSSKISLAGPDHYFLQGTIGYNTGAKNSGLAPRDYSEINATMILLMFHAIL